MFTGLSLTSDIPALRFAFIHTVNADRYYPDFCQRGLVLLEVLGIPLRL